MPDQRWEFDLDAKIRELIHKHSIACEKLTGDQIANALKQALLSGDFIRYVQATNDAQTVIYIPFAREQELEGRIEHLEYLLKKHNIDPNEDLS